MPSHVRPVLCSKAVGRAYGLTDASPAIARPALATWCAAIVLGVALSFAGFIGPILARQTDHAAVVVTKLTDRLP